MLGRFLAGESVRTVTYKFLREPRNAAADRNSSLSFVVVQTVMHNESSRYLAPRREYQLIIALYASATEMLPNDMIQSSILSVYQIVAGVDNALKIDDSLTSTSSASRSRPQSIIEQRQFFRRFRTLGFWFGERRRTR